MKIKDLDDSHFLDFATSKEDKILGDELASVIGDTFIDFNELSPLDQWISIVKALRLHGLQIKEMDNG